MEYTYLVICFMKTMLAYCTAVNGDPKFTITRNRTVKSSHNTIEVYSESPLMCAMMCSSQEKCCVASFSEQTSTCRLDTTDNCYVATDIDVGWSTIARSCSKDACQLSEGYEFIEDGCYCIKYYVDGLDYDSASTVCRQDGGELLKINSRSKQTMVEIALNDLFCVSVAVTVQGTRKTSTSPWLFDDGTAMNYFNWKVNEPSNDIIEFYIYLNPAVNWQWNDIDKKGKSFLCEIRV